MIIIHNLRDLKILFWTNRICVFLVYEKRREAVKKDGDH